MFTFAGCLSNFAPSVGQSCSLVTDFVHHVVRNFLGRLKTLDREAPLLPQKQKWRQPSLKQTLLQEVVSLRKIRVSAIAFWTKTKKKINSFRLHVVADLNYLSLLNSAGGHRLHERFTSPSTAKDP